MKFNYVELLTKSGKHRVLFTEDKKWFKVTDVTTALGNKFIYSAGMVAKELGQDIKMESKTPTGNRLYTFMSVEGLLNLPKLIDSRYPLVNGKKTYPADKRGYYESVIISVKEFRQALELSGVIKAESGTSIVVDLEKPKHDPIEVIMEELIKLSQDIDNRVDMKALNQLSKEKADAEKNLEETKKQLKLSEDKYSELKGINLDLVKQRDNLKAENEVLKKFKNNIESLIGKQ